MPQSRLAARVLTGLYATIRRMVPIDPGRIVFHSYPDADDNALALFCAMEALSPPLPVRVTWLASDVQVAQKRLRASGSSLPVNRILKKNTFKGFYAYLRAGTVFTTHGTYWFARTPGRQRIVNLWHGMPLKKIGLTDGKAKHQVQFCTHTIASSEFFADAMAAAFGLPRDNVPVTGLPRNDWLHAPQDWRTPLNVEARRRLCVWMPTYRKSNVGDIRNDGGETINEELLRRLDVGLNASDAFLLIKLHPMDVLNELHWPALTNVRVLTHAQWAAMGLNVYRVLADAECLISDFSSVTLDYALLRRPIALYVPDLDNYDRGFTPGALERCTSAMCVIKTPAELLQFIFSGGTTGPKDALAELNAPGTEAASRNVLRVFGFLRD